MERPDYESLSSVLKDHPLPWTAVRDFDGTTSAESCILDANNEMFMHVRTDIESHRKVIDLLMYLIPERMPELASPEPTGNAVLDGLIKTYGASSAEVRQRWLERQGVKQHKPGQTQPVP